jgi:hypothetical protein
VAKPFLSFPVLLVLSLPWTPCRPRPAPVCASCHPTLLPFHNEPLCLVLCPSKHIVCPPHSRDSGPRPCSAHPFLQLVPCFLSALQASKYFFMSPPVPSGPLRRSPAPGQRYSHPFPCLYLLSPQTPPPHLQTLSHVPYSSGSLQNLTALPPDLPWDLLGPAPAPSPFPRRSWLPVDLLVYQQYCMLTASARRIPQLPIAAPF